MCDEGIWIGEYILDKDGNPVPEHDILTWAQWFGTADRCVALTMFAWGRVSTIFLGLDRSLCSVLSENPPMHEPILWETMVFGGVLDQNQLHYRSREEALEGHRAMVKECKAAQKHWADRIGLEVTPWVRAVWKTLYRLGLMMERTKRLMSLWMSKSIISVRKMLAAIRLR